MPYQNDVSSIQTSINPRTLERKKSLFSNGTDNFTARTAKKHFSGKSNFQFEEIKEFNFKSEASKIPLKHRKTLLESKQVPYYLFSKRKPVHLNKNSPVLEGNLSKFKFVSGKQIKLSRFYRLTETEIHLYPSLYSKSLIYDKPLETLDLTKIVHLRLTRTVQKDSRPNQIIHIFLEDEGNSGYSYLSLEFEESTKGKDFLTHCCRMT